MPLGCDGMGGYMGEQVGEKVKLRSGMDDGVDRCGLGVFKAPFVCSFASLSSL